MKSKSINPIITLYKEIAKEGFKTTWKHPVFPATLSDRGREEKSFYVVELPIPKIAPFDTAYASVSLKDDRIHCCFTFPFSEAFNDCMGKEDCIKAMDENENVWLRTFHEYFGRIAEYFDLEWEIEASSQEADDEACQMIFYLEGAFEVDFYTRVRILLLEIRGIGR